MKTHFEELFEYTHHFNQKVLELILINLQSCDEKTQKLINHIINAQQIWNARILNQPQFQVWQMNDWTKLAEMDTENYKTSLEILAKTDLDQTIRYSNSRGETYFNTIKDILYHVINHSTYHRAQIATALKQAGIEPIATDYIFFKREME